MGYRILEGDVIDQMQTLADLSVDAIVTDPPYGLEFMGKEWDAPWKTDRRQGFRDELQMPDNPYGRSKVRYGNGASYGADARLMQSLENWHFSWAVEALRVLKPGGHLLAFGGARTYHRLACAVEDAGFEIRDQIMWLYGSGFPKSLDVAKAIDKAAGGVLQGAGVSPEQLMRKGMGDRESHPAGEFGMKNRCAECGKPFFSANPCRCPRPDAETVKGKEWQGWGTALKPAHEPIVVARKPLDGTVAANVLKWGTGALHIDACRIAGQPHHNYGRTSGGGIFAEKTDYPINTPPSGRWPANVIHDGSEQVVSLFPQADSARASGNPNNPRHGNKNRQATSYDWNPETESHDFRDTGLAARFFYCPKADHAERGEGNNHPTVKPVDLMAYLCRLVTPPQGTVLDPFLGSGSTGIAALREGFEFIGIERNPEYVAIARRRIAADAPLLNVEAETEGLRTANEEL